MERTQRKEANDSKSPLEGCQKGAEIRVSPTIASITFVCGPTIASYHLSPILTFSTFIVIIVSDSTKTMTL